MNERRRLALPGLLMALLVLGAVSVFATLELINVTMWAINATQPPAQKYSGTDVAKYPDNIKVASHVDSNGLNVTYIYVLGYTGDITNYTDALQVCNKYGDSPVTVSIRYVGLVGGSYANYIKQFVVYNPANTGQWVGFTYTGQTRNGPVQITTLAPGQCVTLGVSVLVSGDLPKDAWSDSVGTAVPPTDYLAIYQVKILNEVIGITGQ